MSRSVALLAALLLALLAVPAVALAQDVGEDAPWWEDEVTIAEPVPEAGAPLPQGPMPGATRAPMPEVPALPRTKMRVVPGTVARMRTDGKAAARWRAPTAAAGAGG